MRVHGESGIPEGSYPFWKTLFEAIANCGRKVDVDMHAKGVNQTMIDIGAATGMPVTLGAKYSAEHQSLGYNQADIRALEIPNPNHHDDAEAVQPERRFAIVHALRLRRLSSRKAARPRSSTACGRERSATCSRADPEMAAAYGRTSHFCGAVGIDLMEPLTFKGREGSGHPAAAAPMLTNLSTPKPTGRNSSTTIASGAANFTTPTPTSKASRR